MLASHQHDFVTDTDKPHLRGLYLFRIILKGVELNSMALGMIKTVLKNPCKVLDMSCIYSQINNKGLQIYSVAGFNLRCTLLPETIGQGVLRECIFSLCSKDQMLKIHSGLD